jgi:hypothetical protein
MTTLQHSFTLHLKASNEGRGTAQPTVSIDFLCASVKTENVEKMLNGFHGLLNLAVEIQETVPSKL